MLAILGLRGWALWFLGDLGDSAAHGVTRCFVRKDREGVTFSFGACITHLL